MNALNAAKADPSDDALMRTRKTLRFLKASDQPGSAWATGHHGFYFHFLDRDSGTRVWRSEVSLIDADLLMAGVLTAAAYVDSDGSDAIELRQLADALFRRANPTERGLSPAHHRCGAGRTGHRPRRWCNRRSLIEIVGRCHATP